VPFTIRNYDVRTVGSAQVARLAWEAPDYEVDDSTLPTQVALTKDGVYFLSAHLNDKQIASVLGEHPTYHDPPQTITPQTRSDGRYLMWQDTRNDRIFCIGDGPLANAPECDDVCFSEFCVSPENGIVSLSGHWAPNVGVYSARGYEDS